MRAADGPGAMSAPAGVRSLPGALGQKKPRWSRGYLSPACVWRIVLILSGAYAVPDGRPRLIPDPRFIRLRLLACFLPEGNIPSLACYISNTHASRPGLAADVTCCIWDVVQV